MPLSPDVQFLLVNADLRYDAANALLQDGTIFKPWATELSEEASQLGDLAVILALREEAAAGASLIETLQAMGATTPADSLLARYVPR